jgi:hypothetical protein
MNESVTNSLISAKAEIFFPSILFIYLSFLFFYLVVSYCVFTKKTNWGKVWIVLGLTALIMGIIISFICASPEMVNDFILSLKEFIK